MKIKKYFVLINEIIKFSYKFEIILYKIILKLSKLDSINYNFIIIIKLYKINIKIIFKHNYFKFNKFYQILKWSKKINKKILTIRSL